MSKKSVSAKRKAALRKKNKRVAVKDPAQRMYDKLCKEYGTIPAGFSQEKFIPLMKRVIEGALPITALTQEMLTPDCIAGTLKDILGEGITSLPYSVILRNVSTPRRFITDSSGVAYYQRGVLSVYTSNGMRRYNWRDTEMLYCGNSTKLEQLPADMRKWTEEQRVNFMLWKHQNVTVSSVSDMNLTPRGFIRKPIGEKLHQIRRINHRPSKAQRRNIQREHLKLNQNVKIEDKYSLEQ